MSEQAHTSSTMERVQKTLKRRYRKERRFRAMGLSAVVLGLLFVSFLFISIIGNGWSAFQQTYMQLEVELVAEKIDPEGTRDPAVIGVADFSGIIKKSLREEFPGVKKRRAKRALYKIASPGAAFQLREQVLADPDLIGSRTKVWVVADDDVDMFVKGYATDLSRRSTDGIGSATGTEGEIKILSTSNDFTEILADIKQLLDAEAGRLEANIKRSQNGINEVDQSIAELRQEMSQSAGERLERLEGQLSLLQARRSSLETDVERDAVQAADLHRRATTPGGEEQLREKMPSYLVRINGGLVKVTSVSNEGMTGKVLLPLESTTDAAADQWEIIVVETPEAERRLKDQTLAWILKLQQQGDLELKFNSIFFTAGDSREPETAGIGGAVAGSFFMLMVTLLLSFPIGVAAAIYLEEFAPKNKFVDLIEVNINNLAAVPSIVFGLLGLAVFINFFGLPRSAPLVGGLVLTLMTLPTIIIASRAALKSVPPSIREAALGLGASRMQTITQHVLPLAMPGMLTGTIIGMAQALGESAPLLMIGMVAFIVDIPGGPLDPATAMPVQIYLWADSPERAFVERTSAAIMVLLGFLVTMNALAVILRKRFERRW